jgi:hypothetical protein
MTAFAPILRKEAREHRLVLVVLAVLTLVSCLVSLVVELPGLTRNAAFPGLVAVFGVLAVSLTVAPSLIPSEAAEGLRFLGRLPVRPRTVFLAKLSFLMIAAAAIGGLGYGVASLSRGQVAAADPSLRLEWLDLAMLASPLIVGLWLMAITCLIPRPLAAIPAAAVVFVVIGAPMWWALRVPVRPSHYAVGAIAALAVLAPLAAAWLGFRRMLAGGAGSGRTALVVAGALSCFVLPAWGWSAWERWRYENLDPDDPSAIVDGAFLSGDGSRAYLNVRRDGRDSIQHSFVVDLRSGKVIARGGPQSGYVTLESFERDRLPMLGTHEALFHWSGDGLELVDCATGRSRTIPDPRRPSMKHPEVFRADTRACAAIDHDPMSSYPPSLSIAGCDGAWHACRWAPLRSSDGRLILIVRKDRRMFLASWDPKSGDLRIATGDYDTGGPIDGALVPLQWEGDDVIVLAHRRIERLRFGTDWCEVLFPRE